MESKPKETPQVQEPNPVPKPSTPASSTPFGANLGMQGPCATQVKEYEECLQSLSYYWTSCKMQQDKLKACPEFNKYLEKQHRK